MRKTKKELEDRLDIPASFSEVFDSMEDELLVEMAMYYPQQLRDLCIFLTLDCQMAEEEKQHKAATYKN